MPSWRQTRATSGVPPPANQLRALPVSQSAPPAKKFGLSLPTQQRIHPLPKKCPKLTVCHSWTLPWQVCILKHCVFGHYMTKCWVVFVTTVVFRSYQDGRPQHAAVSWRTCPHKQRGGCICVLDNILIFFFSFLLTNTVLSSLDPFQQ